MIDQIKNYFDSNSASVAKLLGVSEAQIHSVQMGRRKLRQQYLDVLQTFIDSLELEKPIHDLVPPTPFSDEEKEIIKKEIEKLNAQLDRKREELAQYQTKRADLKRGLYAITSLLKKESTTPDQQAWLQGKVEELQTKLQSMPQVKEILLQSEIEGLERRLE